MEKEHIFGEQVNGRETNMKVIGTMIKEQVGESIRQKMEIF